MKERIESVQKAFWRLLSASIVVLLLGIPLANDGATMDALEELQGFQQGFDREKIAASVLGHVRALGQVPVDPVLEKAGGPATPAVRKGEQLTAIDPRALVPLDTLAQVNALAGARVEVPVGMADVASLAMSLRWRLARHPSEQGYELTELGLRPGSSKQADLELEAEVEQARKELGERRAALDRAQAAYEKSVELHEARKKWKAPWKAIVRAREKRAENKQEMESLRAQWTAAKKRHEGLARKAEAFKPGPSDDATLEAGVAKAVLSSGDERHEFVMPVALQRRRVTVPGLVGADFPVLRERGMWEEFEDLSAEQAVAELEDRFSWHYSHVDVGGFPIGGMTVLQLAPLVLIFFLISIRRRSRGVGDSYVPWGSATELPRVGFGGKLLNAVPLIALPLLGCLLCVVSLVQIHHLPIVPLLCAAGVTVLGVLCQVELADLAELRDAVSRSQTVPPKPVESASEASER